MEPEEGWLVEQFHLEAGMAIYMFQPPPNAVEIRAAKTG